MKRSLFAALAAVSLVAGLAFAQTNPLPGQIGDLTLKTLTGQVYGTLASFTPPTTFVTNVCNMASLY